MRKNWYYPPTVSGSYGSMAGRQEYEIQMEFNILKNFYRLNYSDLCFV